MASIFGVEIAVAPNRLSVSRCCLSVVTKTIAFAGMVSLPSRLSLHRRRAFDDAVLNPVVPIPGRFRKRIVQ